MILLVFSKKRTTKYKRLIKKNNYVKNELKRGNKILYSPMLNSDFSVISDPKNFRVRKFRSKFLKMYD